MDDPSRDALRMAEEVELGDADAAAPDTSAAPLPVGVPAIGEPAGESVGESVGESAGESVGRGATVGTAAGIAGAAALIAVLTVASRIAGLARTFVFGAVAGGTNLADVYLAANTLPNIIFEIVAGGALAALVVPLLAGHIARGDRGATGRTASALLGWVLVILIPLAVLLALLAYPIMWLLLHHASAAELDAGTRMLRIFAPQLPLYGVGIVLTGVLQAHHRFAWPVLAPLLSSVTVIGAYLLFGALEPAHVGIPGVSLGGELILSVGTTVAVAVLTLCLVLPVRRLGLPWRARLGFDAGGAAQVRSLAAVGVLTVLAQQLSLLAAIVLVTWDTAHGSLLLFTQAQTVYLLPWAVLAVPVATSAYPVLATAYVRRDEPVFGRTLAGAGRSVLVLSGLGAGGMVAVAGPAAGVLGSIAGLPRGPLAATIIAFAPGLYGYGLFALYSRALYARGENRTAARATLIGWGAVVLASVCLALALPAGQRPAAVAAGNSAGMVVLGVALVALVRARAGAGAVAGAARALAVSVFAGSVGAAVGVAVRLPLAATPGFTGSLAQGMLSGVVALAGFLAVAGWLARDQVAPVVRRAVRLGRGLAGRVRGRRGG